MNWNIQFLYPIRNWKIKKGTFLVISERWLSLRDEFRSHGKNGVAFGSYYSKLENLKIRR